MRGPMASFAISRSNGASMAVRARIAADAERRCCARSREGAAPSGAGCVRNRGKVD